MDLQMKFLQKSIYWIPHQPVSVILSTLILNQLQLYDVNSDFSLEPSQKTTRLRVFPRGFQDDVTLTVNATVPVPITISSLAYRLAF